MKVARSKEEPGKGGFWKLDLERLQESRKSRRRSNLSRKRNFESEKKKKEDVVPLATAIPETSETITGLTGEEAATLRDHQILFNNEEIIYTSNDCILAEDNQMLLVPESMPNENVIVESVIDPPNIATEDDLATLLLTNESWDESQLELLDSLLNSL